MIRDEVQHFVALGPLPDSSASEDTIQVYESALERIMPPVSVDEAKMLIRSFGKGDCYGLAWTLVHLIESGPRLPLGPEAATDANEWIRTLWQRSSTQAEAASTPPRPGMELQQDAAEQPVVPPPPPPPDELHRRNEGPDAHPPGSVP